eukprot:15341620-Ditylum_brightwellii.AAC.1
MEGKEVFMPIFPLCQYSLDNGRILVGELNLTLTNINLEASNSFSIYAGRSRGGRQLYFCGPEYTALLPNPGDESNTNNKRKEEDSLSTLPPNNKFCNDTNSSMQFNSSCGALFLVLNTTSKNQLTPLFHAQYSWGKQEIRKEPYELCIDDEEWTEVEEDKSNSTVGTLI